MSTEGPSISLFLLLQTGNAIEARTTTATFVSAHHFTNVGSGAIGLAALPIACVIVALSRGTFRNVVDARWRGLWLIPIAALAPIPLSVWATPADRGTFLPFFVTEACFGLIILVCWLNRHHGWPLALIAVGTLLNMTVIAANSGAMPVNKTDDFETHLYRSELPGDRLLGLHDWINLPGNNSISPGDILVMVGFIAVIVRTSKRRPESADHEIADTVSA